MKIVMIGTGYVGLVTGACFADIGHEVVCLDIDRDKIDRLNNGEILIYEPGLGDMVADNCSSGRLNFTHDYPSALDGAAAAFICVGTPPDDTGQADLSQVMAVAKSIGDHIAGDLVVVDKSTVPVGTADQIRDIIDDRLSARGVDHCVHMVSNPEFLREGNAIDDFSDPDRVVIGVADDHARSVMEQLYAPMKLNDDQFMVMNIKSAEMTKYAANAMLATRISFMNEFANLAEQVGANIDDVRRGIASDHRIGPHFLYAGCGYGGSCFPKDVRAVIQTGRAADNQMHILEAVVETNDRQKHVLFDKLTNQFGDLSDKTIAILGVAFKPGTDDIRESPALTLINDLLDAGANIRLHDPIALDNARDEIGDHNQIDYIDDHYTVLSGVDGAALVTHWDDYIDYDFDRVAAQMAGDIIIDGRNVLNARAVGRAGLTYSGIGR
jgi:UDPglucose 6-dehydrogenase